MYNADLIQSFISACCWNTPKLLTNFKHKLWIIWNPISTNLAEKWYSIDSMPYLRKQFRYFRKAFSGKYKSEFPESWNLIQYLCSELKSLFPFPQNHIPFLCSTIRFFFFNHTGTRFQHFRIKMFISLFQGTVFCLFM